MSQGGSKALDILAKVVSVVFLPNFIPFWCVVWVFLHGLLVLGVPVYLQEFGRALAYTGGILGILPAVLTIFYWKMIGLQNWQTVGIKHRIVPFCFSFAAIALFSLVVLSGEQEHWTLFYLYVICGYALSNLVAFVITLFWKISLHTIGVSGFPLMVILSMGSEPSFVLYLSIAIGIILLVAWARLRLKSHNIAQIVVGFLVGLTAAAVGFTIPAFLVVLPK